MLGTSYSVVAVKPTSLKCKRKATITATVIRHERSTRDPKKPKDAGFDDIFFWRKKEKSIFFTDCFFVHGRSLSGECLKCFYSLIVPVVSTENHSLVTSVDTATLGKALETGSRHW